MITKNYNPTNQPSVFAPKAIWKNKKYKDLDPMSKLVYIALLDRISLSLKNGWWNKEGNVYCRATVRNLAEEFSQTPGNMSKKLKTLEEWGLIVRKTTGMGHADIIFVNEVEPDDHEKNSDDEDFFLYKGVAVEKKKISKKTASVAEMQPNNNNITILENINVKQQHNIESNNSMYTQEQQEESSDVDVVMSTLNSFGFVKSLAVRAIKQYGVRRVREAIEIMRSQMDNVRNKAAFIYAALKNNYQLTKKQENTTPIIQIVTESDSKVALEEDRSNHTNESTNTPCEPPTEKYVVQERPKVDTESEEKIQSMKEWIGRIYKERGEIVRPLHKWMENHGLKLNDDGDVVPAV